MNLNTTFKRVALLVAVIGLIALLVMILINAFTTPQFIAYHMPNGQVFYYKRGAMENSLAERIELILIIFPLAICGLMLFLGYGKKIIKWIRYGSGEMDNSTDINH